MQFDILDPLIKPLPEINEKCYKLEVCKAFGSDLQMYLDNLLISV